MQAHNIFLHNAHEVDKLLTFSFLFYLCPVVSPDDKEGKKYETDFHCTFDLNMQRRKFLVPLGLISLLCVYFTFGQSFCCGGSSSGDSRRTLFHVPRDGSDHQSGFGFFLQTS